MFLCSCKAITDAQVRTLGMRGVVSGPALIEALGLDSPECCGRCVREIERFAQVAQSAHVRSLPFLGVLSSQS